MTSITDTARVTEPPPSSARRDEIIDAATLLFAEHGYHAVGMRAIAEAVGVRSSSLYHHFPSKQALLAAIAGEYSHEFITEHLTILESDEPPLERLQRVLSAQIVYYWEHRLQRWVGLHDLRELENNQPELYQRIQDDRRRYQRALTQTVKQGVADGVFTSTADPTLLTTAIVAMTTGVNDWFHPEGRLTIDEVAERYAELITHDLLGARKAKPKRR